MSKDLISIIVPVYNVEKYINKCLESIINQTYSNLEIILVNDGSTDDSGKICDNYAKKDERIRVVHQKNCGQSIARNNGLKHANGKLVAFSDSDDFLENDCIEYLYNLMQKFNADISICDLQVVYKNIIKNRNTKIVESVETPSVSIFKMLYGTSYYISPCAKLFKKELFDNVNFPESMQFEDVGTLYKLLCKSKNIACSNMKKYYYIMHDNSTINKSFNIKQFDLITMTNKMCDDLISDFPQYGDAILRRRVYAYISTLCRIISSSNEFEKEKREIINYINSNRRFILFNSKVPFRDKIAVFSLMFGEKVFKIQWFIYCCITKRN